jgi:hypothetical protein
MHKLPADFLNGAGHHPEFHNNDLAVFKTQGNASTKRSHEDNVDIVKPAKIVRLNQTSKSSMLNKPIDPHNALSAPSSNTKSRCVILVVHEVLWLTWNTALKQT